jgi:hypothetical protein
MFEDGTPATSRFSRKGVLEVSSRQVGRPSKEKTPTEPLTMPIYDYESLTPEQLRDPARLPKSGLYDQFRGSPVLGEGGNQEESVSYEFRVARVSDFRITWPYLSFWKDVPGVSYKDTTTGLEYHEEPRQKLTWPHIVDGSAQITLMSWHAQSIDAQNHGYVDTEDLVQVIADKDAALWAARGEIQRLTDEKAERKTLANSDLRNRRSSDLEQEELEELIDKAPVRDKRKANPASG